jgi:RimJ/RimL family protein N-acetyltransferase
MLQGEKVVLRALERDDLPRLWRFNNDLEVELAGGGDPPIPQSLARLQAEYEQRAAKGGRDDTHFAIEADGVFIGVCDLRDFDLTDRHCELGITIGDSAYWGQGYGRDAVRLLVEYAFRYRNMNRVFLATNGRNERARRAYAAAGFVEEGRLRQHKWIDGAWDDEIVMGVLRADWERDRANRGAAGGST